MNNLILLAHICASFAAAIHMQTMIMLSWGAGKGPSRVSSMDGDALLRIRIFGFFNNLFYNSTSMVTLTAIL